MQFGAVAFVLAEAILRETRTEVTHYRVARDLCNHARGRNAEAEAIAIDDRGLRKRKRNDRQVRRSKRDRAVRANASMASAHRLVRRAQDVDRIDLDRIDNADRPRHRASDNQFLVNFFASLRMELLGVVQAAMPEFFRENRLRRLRPDRPVRRGLLRQFPQCVETPMCAQFAFMPETTATIHRNRSDLHEFSDLLDNTINFSRAGFCRVSVNLSNPAKTLD